MVYFINHKQHLPKSNLGQQYETSPTSPENKVNHGQEQQKKPRLMTRQYTTASELI
jgi:hypothetical protein